MIITLVPRILQLYRPGDNKITIFRGSEKTMSRCRDDDWDRLESRHFSRCRREKAVYIEIKLRRKSPGRDFFDIPLNCARYLIRALIYDKFFA